MQAWYTMAWGVVDGSLRRWSRQLQKVLGYIRLARTLLAVGLVLILLSGVAAVLAAAGVLSDRFFFALYAISVLWLVVPIAILMALVSLPLKATSVTRLIDLGYPENAREVMIRVLARKLHDQSIETEELLFDTAVNEGKKVLRRMESARAERHAESARQASEHAASASQAAAQAASASRAAAAAAARAADDAGQGSPPRPRDPNRDT